MLKKDNILLLKLHFGAKVLDFLSGSIRVRNGYNMFIEKIMQKNLVKLILKLKIMHTISPGYYV